MITGLNILLSKRPAIADEWVIIALRTIAEAIDKNIFEDVKFEILSPDGTVPGLNDRLDFQLIVGGKSKK